jgi:RNA-directed DNA polymerase
LHQLDLYWWTHDGGLHRKVKERRRQAHQGNCALMRYADDWLLFTNGGKQEAYRLRDEVQTFLAEELKLELAVEKTHVTHVNDGFEFLGFVRHEVAYTAVMTPQGGHNLVCCHQYPTQTCGWSNPTV